MDYPIKYNLLNGSSLSYIGDAYYEIEIRKYLISKNITSSKILREKSIYYVSAWSHAEIYSELKADLTEEELKIFLRGRNGASSNHRKNVDRIQYQISSGFEAIIGYLYLKGDIQRADELIQKAIKIVEEKHDNLW